MYFRANQQFVSFYRSENNDEDPVLFMETVGEEGIVYARREFNVENNNWVHIIMPPRGMAKIKKIVISQGLELDNLRLYMEFPVVVQYVRLQDSDLENLDRIIKQGFDKIHKDKLDGETSTTDKEKKNARLIQPSS